MYFLLTEPKTKPKQCLFFWRLGITSFLREGKKAYKTIKSLFYCTPDYERNTIFMSVSSAEFEWLSAAVWTAVYEQLHVRNPPLYCSIILESQNPPQLNLLQTWTLTLPLPTVDINACTNWAGAATTSFTMSIKTVSNLTQTFLTDQGLCLPDRHTEPQNERTEHGVKSTKVVSQEVTIKYLAINYRDIHQNPYVIKCLSQLLLKPLVRIFRHLLVFKYFSFLSTHNSSFHFIINNAPARCTTAPPPAASFTVWPLAIHFFIIILWWLMLLHLCVGLLKWSSCECHPPTSLVRLMASATKLDY